MKTDNRHGLPITERDRMMRIWERSMELVKEFQTFSEETDDPEMAEIFAEYAEDEGIHASWLREQIQRIGTGE